MKFLLLILVAISSSLVLADTPPQIINKVCPTSQWFKSIVPGLAPTCTQPTYADIFGLPSQTGQSGKYLTTDGTSASWGSVSSGVAWGAITGTLSNQTDLQTALNAKQNTLSFGNFTGSSPFSVTGGTGAIIGSGVSLGVASGFYFPTTSDQSNWNSKQAAGNYLTALTGDVSASGPGSAAATLLTVNSNVGSFTNANITVDGKGRITAAASGSAGGVTSVSGTAPVVSSGGSTPAISMAASTNSVDGYLTAADHTTFNAKQAAGNYITALTGDVAASGPGSVSGTIQSNVVSNAKLTQIGAHSYHGNNTGSTANVANITNTQLTADLNLFSSSLQGLVPASGGGTTNFLRADGTFAAPTGGSGTVTSVALSVPATSIFGVSGSPVTTSGTLGLTTTGTSGGIPYFSSTSQLTSSALLANHAPLVGGGAGAAVKSTGAGTTGQAFISAGASGDPSFGTLGVVGGGTGLTSGTSGGILAFTASGTLASSAALTANRLVLGGGAGVAPTVVGSLGTTTTLLHGNASGAPTYSAVALGTDVSGFLPLLRGGTDIDNSMAVYSTPTGTLNNFTYASSLQRIANNTFTEFTGFVAPSSTEAQRITFYNASGTGSALGFKNEDSGSTAANRIHTPHGGEVTLLPGYGTTLFYDSIDSRWKFADYPVEFAGSGHQGIINIADYNYFSQKQDKVTGTGGVAFSDGSKLINDVSNLHWDSTNNLLGIQTNNPGAVLHSVASGSATVPDVSSGSYSFYAITGTQDPQQPTGQSAFENPGYNGYTENGTTYSYDIYEQKVIGDVIFASAAATASFTDANTGMQFGSEIDWTPVGSRDSQIVVQTSPLSLQSSSLTPLTNTFIDNNDMVNPVNIPPAVSGYSGSGLNNSYDIYAFKVVSGITIYSSTPFNITTADDGSTSMIIPTWSQINAANGYKIIKNGSQALVLNANFPNFFTDYPGRSFPDSLTVTPNTAAYNAAQFDGNVFLSSPYHLIYPSATASTAAIFDASQNLISSSTTSTELGYLSGVTSAIQTQLNAITSGQGTSFLSLSTGSLTSIVANEIIGGGKTGQAMNVRSITASAAGFTCIANPVLTLLDCGTSAGACTSGTTTLGSVTLTAANTLTAGSVSHAAIAANHFWAWQVSSGTCTALNATGSAEAGSVLQ